MEIITRDAAIAAGLTRYFTGNPCIKGHLSERHVWQHRCIECRREQNVSYYAINAESEREKAAQRRAKNYDKMMAQQAEYRARNRDVLRQRTANWRKNNPEKWRETDTAYKSKNYEKVRETQRNRERHLLATDPMFSLQKRVRCLVRDALAYRGHKKGVKTEALLGCDWAFFRTHIERQFVKGMNWENRSLWHIDHITPMATAKTEDDVMALNHFTNLRPMWGKDNIRKGDTVTHLL